MPKPSINTVAATADGISLKTVKNAGAIKDVNVILANKGLDNIILAQMNTYLVDGKNIKAVIIALGLSLHFFIHYLHNEQGSIRKKCLNSVIFHLKLLLTIINRIF